MRKAVPALCDFMYRHSRKEKYFTNDLSQKTFACSSRTLAAPSCMGSWDGKYQLSGFSRKRQKARRVLGMAIRQPVNGVCHTCITSPSYIGGERGSCGGKHVAEVSHSREFYERFAGKLHLRKYIW